MPVETTLANDLLRGAAAIGEYLGLPPRSVYHAAEKGELPIRRVDGLGLVARKSVLEAFFTAPPTPEPAEEEPHYRIRNPRARR